MSQPSPFDRGMKAATGIWWLLFGILLLFVVGVVVWALAGPAAFAVIVVVLVALPLYLWGRGASK